MEQICQLSGCKFAVPTALGGEGLCVLHFLARVEADCAALRHETVIGVETSERYDQITRHITQQGEKLASLATSGLRLPDEIKNHLLTVFLVLINLRENIDRAVGRAAGRKSAS